MNMNHKLFTKEEDNMETTVVENQEVKEPGKVRQFIDKHEITPKKVVKTAVKGLAIVGGAFGVGYIFGKRSNDDDDCDDQQETYSESSNEYYPEED